MADTSVNAPRAKFSEMMDELVVLFAISVMELIRTKSVIKILKLRDKISKLKLFLGKLILFSISPEKFVLRKLILAKMKSEFIMESNI